MLRSNLTAYCFLLILLTAPIRGNDLVDVTFHSALSFPVDWTADSIAVGDFTGNGYFDVVTCDGAGRIYLLEGDGAGAFAEAVQAADTDDGAYIAAADLNSDGILDLVVPKPDRHEISVLLGAGGGNFQAPVSYPAGLFPVSVATGDFNGDGVLDVAAVHAGSDDAGIWFGDGSGGLLFQQNYAVGDEPRFLVEGDLDGDGILDLAVVNRLSNSVTVLLNEGSGTFTAAEIPVGSQPFHITAADFNGDGNLDLAVANVASHHLSILLGRGDGTFDSAPDVPDWGPIFTVTGDWNQDGIVDLAILNYNAYGLRIVLGVGDGTFIHSRRYVAVPGLINSRQLAVADFNEDGIPDLVDGSWSSVTVFLGGADGEFQAAPLIFAGVTRPQWTGIADFNGDGLNDTATVSEAWRIAVRSGTGDGEFGPPDTYAVSCESNFPLRDGLLTDLNADGETDIVALCYGGGVWTLLGNGDGTFQPPVRSDAPAPVIKVAAGLFDGDIFPDLVIPVAELATFLMRGNGDGTFQAPEVVAFGALYIAVDDFNQDGKPDLALDLWNWDGSRTDLIVTLLNDGAGQFSFGGAVAIGLHAFFGTTSIGDFNEDGFPDLALTRTAQEPGSGEFTDRVILLNDGSGALQGPILLGRLQSFSTPPVTGDFNNDGHTDIVVNTTKVRVSNVKTVLLGRGDGTFEESRWNYPLSGGTVAVGDINNDGLPDLVIAGTDRPWISFLINTTEVE